MRAPDGLANPMRAPGRLAAARRGVRALSRARDAARKPRTQLRFAASSRASEGAPRSRQRVRVWRVRLSSCLGACSSRQEASLRQKLCPPGRITPHPPRSAGQGTSTVLSRRATRTSRSLRALGAPLASAVRPSCTLRAPAWAAAMSGAYPPLPGPYRVGVVDVALSSDRDDTQARSPHLVVAWLPAEHASRRPSSACSTRQRRRPEASPPGCRTGGASGGRFASRAR